MKIRSAGIFVLMLIPALLSAGQYDAPRDDSKKASTDKTAAETGRAAKEFVKERQAEKERQASEVRQAAEEKRRQEVQRKAEMERLRKMEQRKEDAEKGRDWKYPPIILQAPNPCRYEPPPSWCNPA